MQVIWPLRVSNYPTVRSIDCSEGSRMSNSWEWFAHRKVRKHNGWKSYKMRRDSWRRSCIPWQAPLGHNRSRNMVLTGNTIILSTRDTRVWNSWIRVNIHTSVAKGSFPRLDLPLRWEGDLDRAHSLWIRVRMIRSCFIRTLYQNQLWTAVISKFKRETKATRKSIALDSRLRLWSKLYKRSRNHEGIQ